MEFENSNITFVRSQEVYAQEEDLSFDADQENLNTSTSSDRFATPSAKLIYDSISIKKQPSQNVRQSLFQNLDPLNESNSQNKNQSLNNAFTNSFDTTVCTDKTVINNNNSYSTNDRSTTELFSERAMDLSNHQNSNNKQLADQLREERMANEKLRTYVEQLNELNKNLSDAILTVQDKFEANLNEKNAIIQDLQLQNNVITKERKLAVEDVQGLENSFSELHRRYEKLKLTLESCKKKRRIISRRMPGLL